MVTIGQKIYRFIKPRGITAKSLADFLPVDQGLISKWKTGERTLQRDSYIPPMIADFMIQHLSLESEQLQQEYDTIRRSIVRWLFDGKDTAFPYEAEDEDDIFDTGEEPGDPAYSYVGMDGLSGAVSALCTAVRRAKGQPEITVYISSEYSMLFSDPIASKLWDTLYKANGERVVQIVFEQWKNEGRIAEISQQLMPYIQSGKVALSYILSAEKYLCYNVSICAEGTSLVMMTEPAGAGGSCVSFYIDDKGFLFSMGEVLKKLRARALPMVEVWQSDKNKGAGENKYLETLLHEAGELDMLHYGMNLLHLPPDAYAKLLKINGFSDSQVRIRTSNFEKQKAQYEAMLLHNRCREAIRFDLLDDAVHSSMLDTTDLFFYNRSRLQAGRDIILGLLSGMTSYLDTYPNLHIALLRDPMAPQVSIKLKEDRLLLMHTAAGGMQTICSENWLLCNNYRQYFEQLWTNGKNSIKGKSNVAQAIQNRVDKLGRK